MDDVFLYEHMNFDGIPLGFVTQKLLLQNNAH